MMSAARSEVGILRARLHTMTLELHALLQRCWQAWEGAGLGWLEFPQQTTDAMEGPSRYMPWLVV